MVWPLLLAKGLISPPGTKFGGSDIFRLVCICSSLLSLSAYFLIKNGNCIKNKKTVWYSKVLIIGEVIICVNGYTSPFFNLTNGLMQLYVYSILITFFLLGSVADNSFLNRLQLVLLIIFYVGSFLILYSKDLPGPKYFLDSFKEVEYSQTERYTNSCAYYLRNYILCWPVIFFNAYINKTHHLVKRILAFATLPIYLVINVYLFKFRSEIIYSFVILFFFLIILLLNKKIKVNYTILLSVPLMLFAFVYFGNEVNYLKARVRSENTWDFRLYEVYSWVKTSSIQENIFGRGIGTSYKYYKGEGPFGDLAAKTSMTGNSGFHLGILLPVLHGGLVFFFLLIVVPFYKLAGKLSSSFFELRKNYCIEITLLVALLLYILTTPVLAEMDRVFQISFYGFAVGKIMFKKIGHSKTLVDRSDVIF
jgi:hypothetical protein